MLTGILLIVLGLLAVPSLILSKKPNAKELFDKVAPFQGWLGILFVFWGIWELISCFSHMELLSMGFARLVFFWVYWLCVAIVEIVLGFILGYGLIQKYALSKNEKAKEKGEQVLKKLLPLQGTLGIAAIILGIIYIVLYIMWM